MFTVDSSDSDSENDVWVGPHTLEEVIYNVTKSKRAPIGHRHSCISSFRDLAPRDEPSGESTSETSYTTACDTEHGKVQEPNKNYNFLQSFATNQSSDKTTLDSSYNTACSEFHNRSNHVIEATAEDFDSEQSSSSDDLQEENLSALSLESKSSEDYSFQHYYDAEKNAQESVHNENSRISEKLSVTETYRETAEANIREDFDAEQKWTSAKEVYSIQSSVSELREENATAITIDSNSSRDYTSSSAGCTSTQQKSVLDCKSDYDSSRLEESVASLHLMSSDERLSDSFTLDDTMEELNQFIQQGPDYVMSPRSIASENVMSPKSKSSASLRIDNDFTPIARSTNVGDFSERLASPSGSSSKSSCSSTGFKSKLPTFTGRKQMGRSAEKPNKVKTVEKPVKSAEMPDFEFKVPKAPLNRTPRSKLEHVVSPVGIYIKYSPRYAPLVKVPATSNHSKTKLFVAETPSKENIPGALNCEIPAVIYKPAATRLASEQQDVKLPNSIKKLLSPQVVTKHERRIERQQHDVSIERRLLESDLTISDDDNTDVSIVVNKQPFAVKKL